MNGEFDEDTQRKLSHGWLCVSAELQLREFGAFMLSNIEANVPGTINK